ncbi:MAG: class I SAM-dependent methyltransferase [Spirochaetales bacterium]|nr:class I SAM-dependent methyltransferase [Spirochaetales bacterium]
MDFYTVLSRYYEEIFPLSQSCADFISRQMPSAGTVLDAGCGTGELVLDLQDRGIDASGFDLDEGMILNAASAASKQGLPGNELFTICGLADMKNRFEAQVFGGISCLGNTLAHVPFNEQFQFLQDAASLLGDKGVLIVQILNYSNIIHDGLQFPLIETDHCNFRRRYEERENPSELDFVTELEIRESGEVFSNRIVHYPLLPETLMAALSMAGYAEWETYGGYDGSPAGEGKLPLIVKAGL